MPISGGNVSNFQLINAVKHAAVTGSAVFVCETRFYVALRHKRAEFSIFAESAVA